MDEHMPSPGISWAAYAKRWRLRMGDVDAIYSTLEEAEAARADLIRHMEVPLLRKYRMLAGLSQQDLADAIGTSRVRLTQIESSGDQSLRKAVERIDKLSEVLGISRDQVIEAVLHPDGEIPADPSRA